MTLFGKVATPCLAEISKHLTSLLRCLASKSCWLLAQPRTIVGLLRRMKPTPTHRLRANCRHTLSRKYQHGWRLLMTHQTGVPHELNHSGFASTESPCVLEKKDPERTLGQRQLWQLWLRLSLKPLRLQSLKLPNPSLWNGLPLTDRGLRDAKKLCQRLLVASFFDKLFFVHSDIIRQLILKTT